MRRPSLFKERDVTRLTRAVLAAGLGISRIEMTKDGAIIVFPGKSEESANAVAETNEWDGVV
jgi:hypothetical protein